MGDRPSAHLSDEQLSRFQDGAPSPSEASHLQACPECGSRLGDLEAAAAAYLEYRDSIRGPALAPVPKPWRSLDALIAEHDFEHRRPAWRLWLIPAVGAAVCLALIVTVQRRPARQLSRRATELLMQSAREELPPNRMISMRVHGRTLIRPAVLVTPDTAPRDPDLARLAALFSEAHYSWREPLSARSFQSWRSRLPDKRDSVTVIDAGGPKQAYRIQTDSAAGVLRRASLTLRGKTLRPTDGAFQFEGEAPLEMGETAAPAATTAEQPRPALREEPPAEIPATPADTLHVLAALNEIGADVGEPIDISATGEQVVVHAGGLSSERRRQVAEVLAPLPRVRFDFDSAAGAGAPAPAPTGAAERFSTDMPDLLRRLLEDRLGGATALQEMTDRVLEGSGSVVARAHALEVLASHFPPGTESALAERDRDLLERLRQSHISALRRLAAQIRTEVRPLWDASGVARPLASEEPGTRSWQAQAHDLMAIARALDDSLNRLLAGNYSESSGESIIRGLGAQLQQLEQVLGIRQEAGR